MITYRRPRAPWGPHEAWNSGMTLGKHERQSLNMAHTRLSLCTVTEFQTLQNPRSNSNNSGCRRRCFPRLRKYLTNKYSQKRINPHRGFASKEHEG